MSKLKNLLLIIPLSILTSCASAAPVEVQPPVSKTQASVGAVVPLSEINLAAIGHKSKGRVQDLEYNDLPEVKNLIAHGKNSIPYLISKLDDETEIKRHVLPYWYHVYVADVALIILIDFFTDATWNNSTIPGLLWDDFLERKGNPNLTGEQVLRNYVSKHGRKKIKDRWEKIWREYQDRLFWDENQKCFKLTA